MKPETSRTKGVILEFTVLLVSNAVMVQIKGAFLFHTHFFFLHFCLRKENS